MDGTDRVARAGPNGDLPIKYWDATGLPAGHPEAEQEFHWICIPDVMAEWRQFVNPGQQYDLWR